MSALSVNNTILLFAIVLVFIYMLWRLKQKEQNGYRRWQNILLQTLKITIRKLTKIYNRIHTQNISSINPNLHLKVGDKLKLLVLFRGPSACGKTTIANKLIKRLKFKNNPSIYSLYFEEDRYRSKLQCRYNSSFIEPHLTSSMIICNMIENIITNINNEYQIFIVDGLIRYKEQRNNYLQFVKNINDNHEKYGFKIKVILFQFHCLRDIRKYRDMKSETREHCVGIGDGKGARNQNKKKNTEKVKPFCCWYCKQNELFPAANIEIMKEFRESLNVNDIDMNIFKFDTSKLDINQSIEHIIKCISSCSHR